jgi:hypothetical protein
MSSVQGRAPGDALVLAMRVLGAETERVSSIHAVRRSSFMLDISVVYRGREPLGRKWSGQRSISFFSCSQALDQVDSRTARVTFGRKGIRTLYNFFHRFTVYRLEPLSHFPLYSWGLVRPHQEVMAFAGT